ncbi:MAG: hypothetical protein ACRELV_12310 [Longimicrobiales bacterium]
MMSRSRPRVAWLPLLALLACAPAEDDVATTPADEQGTESAPPLDTPDAKILNATSAAPAALAAEATVMDWPAAEGEEMTELRAGTNGWTCLPNIPHTPGNDPMCGDARFFEWAAAWQSRTTPPEGGVGLAYMLQGGADASNADPFATEPPPGESWVRSGPHVMIVMPDAAVLASMSDDPASGGPWVMWRGTPYAHIMMPVAM